MGRGVRTSEAGQEPRKVGRVVLTVAIQRADDCGPRGKNPRTDRPALTRIAPMAKQAQRRQIRFEGGEFGERIVAAGVIDENHLVGTPLERRGDLARQRGCIAFLVMHRHYDAEFDGFRQGAPLSLAGDLIAAPGQGSERRRWLEACYSQAPMRPPVSTALFDQFARGWRGYIMIGLIALVSSLMGIGRVGVLDADEARFAQASRQMVESGDYVRIRLQGAERNRKPIGIYWLQAGSAQLFAPIAAATNEIWPYRLPSALGAALAAIAALWGGSALIGQRGAFLGAGLFAAGMLLGLEGMTAKTDAVLVGCTTLALAALARLRTGGEQAHLLALLFWGALACGVLIKGPVTPLVAVLTLATLALWERRGAWMKPLLWWPGPLLAALIAAPWMIAIASATEGRFFSDFLNVELWPKLTGAEHGAWPGYHLGLLPILLFPATYALPAAVRLFAGAARGSRDDPETAGHRFLLAWAVPSFLIFEILPGKLAHYVLPTYPALALMCGAGLLAMRGRRWRTVHPIGVVFFAVSGAVIVLLMAFSATLMPGDLAADARRAVSTGIIGAASVAATVAALLLYRRPAIRAGALVACALVLSFSLRERLLPESRALFPSNEIVAALTRERLMPNDERQLWSVGYDAPSLVFLTRTSIRIATPEEAAEGAAAGDALVVEGRVLDATLAALSERSLALSQRGAPIRGFGLSNGQRVALYFGAIVDGPANEVPAGAPPRTP